MTATTLADPAPPTGRRLRDRLLHRDPVLRRLAALTMVNTVGSGLSMTLGVLYFTRVLGFGVGEVGVVLTAAGGCGVLAGIPAGRVSDRFGPKPMLIVLNVLLAAGTACYTLVHSLPALAALACLVTVVDRSGSTARGALYAEVLPPEQRVEGRAYLRSVTNVGISVGTLLAALVLQADTRAAYQAALLADALSFAVVAVLYAVTVPGTPRTGGTAAREQAGGRNPALRNLPFLAVTALNGLLCLQFAMIEVGVPLWIVRDTDAPRVMVAGSMLVNTALVIMLQVRATRGTEEPARAARAVGRGGLLVAGACLLLGLAAGVPAWAAVLLLAGGIALQALGEVLSQAGGWALSYDLAEEGKHGVYQGVFNTGQSAAFMLGPVLVTSAVITHGLLGWALLAALFAAAGLAMGPAVRRARRAAAAA
ncbi:MFS transporter [Kitasatospora terrestris]|uniref:MFS transporter n=1 Tax=Kitasatospora terrestris TaxID=258051 RepID=A0ABP9DFI2_9ACTN